jgi:predicted naringenin-chalcone synthase
LGLKPDVARVNVCFMGCAGGIAGLRLAKALVEADEEAVVLLACVEVCSIHFQRDGNVDQAVANALFGDGAASCIVRSSARGRGLAQIGRCSTLLLSGTSDTMSWRLGDQGCMMTLAGEVPEIIEQRIGGWAETELRRSGLATRDVRGWCVHPGGPKILSAVERGLGLDAAALTDSRHVLAQHGNMSSTTVFFVLNLLRRRVPDPLPAVLLGFSPGLTSELALLEAPESPV